eukprot:365680-Chlamydomonas_euryale.AAC.7
MDQAGFYIPAGPDQEQEPQGEIMVRHRAASHAQHSSFGRQSGTLGCSTSSLPLPCQLAYGMNACSQCDDRLELRLWQALPYAASAMNRAYGVGGVGGSGGRAGSRGGGGLSSFLMWGRWLADSHFPTRVHPRLRLRIRFRAELGSLRVRAISKRRLHAWWTAGRQRGMTDKSRAKDPVWLAGVWRMAVALAGFHSPSADQACSHASNIYMQAHAYARMHACMYVPVHVHKHAGRQAGKQADRRGACMHTSRKSKSRLAHPR